jgi:hypothetical protein
MKRLTQIFVFALVAMLLSGTALAQNEGHFYSVTTWKMQVPADGSAAELNELFKEWYEKITTKNDKVLSQKVLRHVTGADMRDWVVISEYASWNDMDAANDMQSKLVEEAWPNEDDRRAWFAKFGKYTVTHSDEILQERPGLTK